MTSREQAGKAVKTRVARALSGRHRHEQRALPAGTSSRDQVWTSTGECFGLTDEDVARVLHDSYGIDKLSDDDWIA
jgi:hypothetical protein